MSELSVGSLSGLAANSYVIDVASGSTLDLSAGAVLPAGSILSVHSAQMTAVQTFSGGADDLVDLTGLSVTITPKSATSKFWVFGAWYGAGSQTNAESFLRGAIVRDGTVLVNNLVGIVASGNTLNSSMISVYKLDEPATTSPVTYKLQGGQNGAFSSVTVYVNRRIIDSTLIGNSFITVLEVAG